MTAAQLTIRRARCGADVESVVKIWNEAAAWLAGRRLDQWQYPVRRDRIEYAAAAGSLWLIEDVALELTATVTLDEYADPKLWTPEDGPEQALYLHRLVVRSNARGAQLGSHILDWCGERAERQGKPWLRLDAWTNNPGLHRYYLDQQFHLVRTVDKPGIVSGVLFERPSRLRVQSRELLHEQ